MQIKPKILRENSKFYTSMPNIVKRKINTETRLSLRSIAYARKYGENYKRNTGMNMCQN